jgi:SMC interacting uncharacterized protein involved in chromosome segregation
MRPAFTRSTGMKRKAKAKDTPFVAMLRKELEHFNEWHSRDLDYMREIPAGRYEDMLDVLDKLEQRLKSMISRITASRADIVHNLIDEHRKHISEPTHKG